MSEQEFMPDGGPDSDIEYHRVGDDVLWGFKVFFETGNSVPTYLFEVFIKDEEGEPIYVREKMVGDPITAPQTSLPYLISRLVRVLSSPAQRVQLRHLSQLLREDNKVV